MGFRVRFRIGVIIRFMVRLDLDFRVKFGAKVRLGFLGLG